MFWKSVLILWYPSAIRDFEDIAFGSCWLVHASHFKTGTIKSKLTTPQFLYIWTFFGEKLSAKTSCKCQEDLVENQKTWWGSVPNAYDWCPILTFFKVPTRSKKFPFFCGVIIRKTIKDAISVIRSVRLYFISPFFHQHVNLAYIAEFFAGHAKRFWAPEIFRGQKQLRVI